MSNEFIAQFISQFLLYAIGVVVLYLNQRAINKGNQDDIKKLTRITEATKKEFTDKTEELKAQLSLINQHTLNLKKEQRDALIDFNRKSSELYYRMVRFSVENYDYNNYLELTNILEDIEKRKAEVYIAGNHLDLFLEDDEFKNIRNELKRELLDYQTFLTNKIHDMQLIFLEYKREAIGKQEKELIELQRKYVQIGGEYAMNFLEEAFKQSVKADAAMIEQTKVIKRILDELTVNRSA